MSLPPTVQVEALAQAVALRTLQVLVLVRHLLAVALFHSRPANVEKLLIFNSESERQ
jgi:hypothetical protein